MDMSYICPEMLKYFWTRRSKSRIWKIMPVQITKYAVIFHILCQYEWNYASQNRLACFFQHHCLSVRTIMYDFATNWALILQIGLWRWQGEFRWLHLGVLHRGLCEGKQAPGYGQVQVLVILVTWLVSDLIRMTSKITSYVGYMVSEWLDTDDYVSASNIEDKYRYQLF